MTRDKFYKKLNNDISKKLQKIDKSIKVDPVSISVLRNFYFLNDKNVLKTAEVLGAKVITKKLNKASRAWAYERALAILEYVVRDEERMAIAFAETKWEAKDVPAK